MGSIALKSPCIPVITGAELEDEEVEDADPPPPHETTKEIVNIKKSGIRIYKHWSTSYNIVWW